MAEFKAIVLNKSDPYGYHNTNQNNSEKNESLLYFLFKNYTLKSQGPKLLHIFSIQNLGDKRNLWVKSLNFQKKEFHVKKTWKKGHIKNSIKGKKDAYSNLFTIAFLSQGAFKNCVDMKGWVGGQLNV